MDSLLVLSAGVRAVHYASALLVFGDLVFLLAVARPALAAAGRPPEEAASLERALFRLLLAGLAGAVLTAFLWLWLLAASMSGRSAIAALDFDLLVLVATQTRFGTVWLVRMAAAACLATLLAWQSRHGRTLGSPRMALFALLLAGIFLAAIGFAGHAGDESGVARLLHLGGDTLHLLAAGAWLGGLPGLTFLLARAGGREARGWFRVAQRAVPRFSTLGLTSVATLVATGLDNSWFLVGSVPALVGTDYGHLLVAKLVLLVVMVILASVNRWRLMPRLVAPEAPRRAKLAALSALRRNAAIETAVGILIVAIVGTLVGTAPAAHQQPYWPFPYRLAASGVSLSSHGRAVLVVAGCLALVGLAAALVGLMSRIWWRSAAGVALLAFAIAIAAPHFLVAAYPTSFYRSPVPYGAAAIARGQAVYQENCAACHGPYGYGDGPAADGLAVKPSDLTEPTLFHQGAGAVFWWIASGSRDGAMPSFAESLDAGARWDVVAFLRAQSDAEAANGMTAAIEPFRAVPAPDFTFQFPGGQEETLAEERGKAAVLLVLYRLPDSLARLGMLAAARPALARAGARVVAFPLDGKLPAPAEAAPLAAILADVNAEAVAAYSLFRRTTGAEAVLPLPAEMEFLIDRSGYLRARALKGEGRSWDDLAELEREIASLAREPLRPPPREEAHSH